ncbi:FecCD family ABC transporter permease [Cryptosporangium arvum]|uniref:ABC-type enterobactin transport system, permease component n=1 Tax=Cryptosporangium arvum DSM 44712 TaxID=927661 RepID=A0A010ZPH7_9ACTN|nr:iron chelate uptake ABC transporter family permease subunit [Cryptosporangium arvum]EXG80589.1 ABC-type enterobactin transport system, permease component [Cryptosporangium arvum DSM 44712]
MTAVPVLAAGPVVLRVHRRSVVVCLVLGVLLLAAIVLSLAAGTNSFPLDQVFTAVFGEGKPATELIVAELRLPRAVTGALVGIALGISGGIFQSLTRNPLGSPDVVGFGQGATTGALVTMLLLHGGFVAASFGAVVGGVVTAALVFGLAYHRGSIAPLRIVLVGLGLALMLISVNQLLIVRSQLYDAQSASAWIVGSLAGREWNQVKLMGAVLVVGLVACVFLMRPLSLSEFSDERSMSLGLRIGRARFAAVGTGVLLASAAVAAAGPIQFVALPAPQIARRLTRAAGPNLTASGLTGGLLLVLADFLAREAFQPRLVPVGVVTGVVGGLYLAWLLSREWKKGRA